MHVETVGTARSIADIGSQLGWLATTLSSFHPKGVISFCHPEISGFNAHVNEDGFDNTFVCRVNTEIEHLKDNLPSANGQCWYRLFNNPVVVTGYPIKPRKDSLVEAGLELPFDMMATLSECQFMTTWGGKTVIKGFSSMLIPTKAQDNVISWHLIVSEAGKRLPYRDDRVSKGISIAPRILPKFRHILGWCSEAQNDIGKSHRIKRRPEIFSNMDALQEPLGQTTISDGPAYRWLERTFPGGLLRPALALAAFSSSVRISKEETGNASSLALPTIITEPSFDTSGSSISCCSMSMISVAGLPMAPELTFTSSEPRYRKITGKSPTAITWIRSGNSTS
jgi:hypothetical protein